MQFMFAADRGHPKLADRYDPLSPALLAFLHWVVQQCRSAGKPVTLCGEMGSRTLEAMALLGIGLERLSMPASAVGPVTEIGRAHVRTPVTNAAVVWRPLLEKKKKQ